MFANLRRTLVIAFLFQSLALADGIEDYEDCVAGENKVPVFTNFDGVSVYVGCITWPDGFPSNDPMPTAPVGGSSGDQFPQGPPSIDTPVPGIDNGKRGHGACAMTGNPINILTRNKYQREGDFTGPGNLPLRITRHYNSYFAYLPNQKGPFGKGWNANFSEKIIAVTYPDPADSPTIFDVLIKTETGYRFRITSTDGGEWKTSNGRVIPFDYDETEGLFTWVDDGLIKVFHESGNLISIQDESGEELTLSYVDNSSPAQVDKITHSLGGELTFTYDSSDPELVSTITGSNNETWQYVYDANGNLDHVDRPAVSGVDAVSYSYTGAYLGPALGLLTEISYPQDRGAYAKFDYDSAHYATYSEHVYSTGVDHVDLSEFSSTPLTIQVTNPHGKQTKYEYDDIAGMKRLKEVVGLAHGTCAASNSQYTYDANGFYDKITDEEGNVVDYDYNEYGQIESITTGFGTSENRTTSYTWDEKWNKLKTITAPLLDTVFELDDGGRVTKITQTNTSPLYGNTTPRIWDITYEHHLDSSIVKKVIVDGPRTDVGIDDETIYDYDTSGRLTSITEKVTGSLNLVTSYTDYDAYGRVGKITFPTGMTRELTYDPLGRVLTTTDTVDSQTRLSSFEYTHAGDLEKITLSDGTSYEYSYDSARRLYKVLQDDDDTDPEDVHWQYFYRDTASNVTGTEIYERSEGFVLNLPCFPMGPWCWTVEWTDVLKYKKNFDHDSLDRLVKVNSDRFSIETEITEYSYDKANRLTSIDDAYGRSTSIDYDANSQVDTTTYRDGGISDIEYNANGAITGIQDALGQWTYYRRDGFGQAWEIVSPATDLSTFYEYDAAGNMTKKTDARLTELNYEYDALNRLLNVKVGASSTAVQEFEYDTDQPGYLYKATDEAGEHTFTRNQEGAILTGTDTLDSQPKVMTYTYDSHGRVDTITYPTNLVVDYHYDSFGDVEKITATGAGLSQSDVVKNAQYLPLGPIWSFEFGNDELRSYTRATNYKHWIIGSGEHFTSSALRDLNGNITDWDGREYTYDEMDRLETHSGPDGDWEYGYDLNGNRNYHKEDTVQTSYTYNTAKTRLNTLSGGVTESRYYDANGNTIQIGNRYFDHDDLDRFWRYRDGSLTVEYKHDSFGARAAKDDGTTTTRFMYDGPYLLHEDNGNLPRDYIYLQGDPVAFVQDGILYFIHNDYIGRPQVVTNSAQTVRWSRENNANGGVPITDLIGGLNIGFPGQYYDVESGTHYNYHRTYDPSTGRYLESDPIGLAGGLNTYSYVGGNPLAFVDPYGLDKLILFDPNALFTGDKILYMKARDFPDDPNKLSVFAHGNNESIKDDRGGKLFNRESLLPKDLVDLLEKEGLLGDDKPIELIGCETASGENSFAKQLSDLLGERKVIGYPHPVTMQDDKVIGVDEAERRIYPPTPVEFGE